MRCKHTQGVNDSQENIKVNDIHLLLKYSMLSLLYKKRKREKKQSFTGNHLLMHLSLSLLLDHCSWGWLWFVFSTLRI